MFNVTVLLFLSSNHTIVMLSAIRELADKKDFSQCHSATTEYVEACNNLFERGVLSHKMITHPLSEELANMHIIGFSYFLSWHQYLQPTCPGMLSIHIHTIHWCTPRCNMTVIGMHGWMHHNYKSMINIMLARDPLSSATDLMINCIYPVANRNYQQTHTLTCTFVESHATEVCCADTQNAGFPFSSLFLKSCV